MINTIEEVNKISNYILNNEETTFYTENEIFTVNNGIDIHLFTDYKELCDEWLNIGLNKSDDSYRNYLDTKTKSQDKKEYYDYRKNIWFVVN